MNSALLQQELLRDEGARFHPYRDSVGKLTIGVGRNLDDVGISEDEAALMLSNDIARTMAALDRVMPWWRDLNEARQRVIVNMAFNMGVNALMGFKNTLSAIQAGNYNEAANEMLASKWAQQVGARAQRLADMMRKGD